MQNNVVKHKSKFETQLYLSSQEISQLSTYYVVLYDFMFWYSSCFLFVIN